MKKNFYVAAVALCVLCAACSKAGGDLYDGDPNAIDNSDDVLPVIAVTSPMANQVYNSGDSIIVEGKVTDDKKLYKGKVSIKNDVINYVIAEGYYETHVSSIINYRLAYKIEVTSATDFSILVEFQDHGANISLVTIKVKVNP